MEVYFDNSATTRCYDSVKDIVVKTMTEDFGNPSAMHLKGVEAEKYVKEATKTIAGILKVQEKEILFTSGGTESDNLALIGGALANKRNGNHIIITRKEPWLHPDNRTKQTRSRNRIFHNSISPSGENTRRKNWNISRKRSTPRSNGLYKINIIPRKKKRFWIP